MTGKHKVLIVVDMQNDFIDGALGTKEAVAIVPAVKAKIEEYRRKGGIIFFTRDTHHADYLETSEGKHLPVEHCIWDTDGWQIRSELTEEDCGREHIIDKPTFGWKHWEETFEKYNVEPAEIEIIGLCTDICVVSNAIILKAAYPEALISTDAACCAGVTPESHEAALTTMRMCQIEVTA